MCKLLHLKDYKILKPITILTVLYSAFMFFKYAASLILVYATPQSPLLPKQLNAYASFPLYFLVAFFGVLSFFSMRSLWTKQYNVKRVYALFGIVFLFCIFQWHIYQCIMRFNPYG